MKKVLKNKKGFTLVELMVVVAILGVLVAVAVPAYNGITDSANLKVCASNLRTIESAILQAEVKGATLTSGKLSAGGTGLEDYLKDSTTITCPSGGEYTFTAAVKDATGKITAQAKVECSKTGHTKAAAAQD